jgi:large subunit ribosomal protein L25
METKLVATRRSKLGSSASRRLRAQGLVPGIIYGHKQESVAVTFPAKEAEALARSSHRVVDIELDGKSETTLLRDTQWDVFHSELRHLDFMRVDPNERVKVDVDVVLRGIAVGTLSGGVLDHALHTVHVDCLAVNIPEAIVVKIQGLKVGDIIHVRELELPPGVKILNPPDAIVVRVTEPIIVEAATPAEAPGPAEPELIKKEKKTDEEAEAADAKK